MAKNIGATLSLKNGNFFTGLKSASKGIKDFKSKLNEGTGALKKHSSQANSTGSALSGLKGKVKGIVSAYASLAGIKKIGALSDEMTSTKARLDMVNDGLQTNAELQKMIFKSAKDSRGQYKSTADFVARLGNNCSSAFSSTKEMVIFAEQLNKRFVLAGATATEASSATIQLAQGMAAGALRGEELNSVLENAPNIVRAIEKYMGVPQSKIREIAKDGKITANIIKGAILSTADETNAKFNEMPMTWGQIWQNMKTTGLQAFDPILSAVNKIANSDKFQSFVKKATDGIEKLSNSGAIDKFANNIVDGTIKAMETIGGIVSFIKEHWGTIGPLVKGVLTSFLAYKGLSGISSVFEGLSNNIGLVTKGFSAAKNAKGFLKTMRALGSSMKNGTGIVKLLGGAFTFLSSPVGIVIVIIGAVVAAFVYCWNKFEGFRNFWIKAWEGIKGAVKTAVDKVVSVFDTLKEKIFGLWDKIKGIWEKIFGGGDKDVNVNISATDNFGDGISRPAVLGGVQEFASGGIMRRPTMFGINGNRPMIGGEAGAEAILPLSQFWYRLGQFINSNNQKATDNRVVNNYFNISVEKGTDDEETVNTMVKKIKEVLNNM